MSAPSDIKQRFLTMSKQFKWRHTPSANATKNDSKKERGDSMLNENANIVNQPDTERIHDNEAKQKQPAKNQSDGTTACSLCGAAISLFLIHNHERHCSRTPHIDDDEESEEREEDEEAEPAPKEKPVAAEQKEASEGGVASAANSSLLSVALVECKYCEFEEVADRILEHETWCGSRTEVCPHCLGRDTVCNLVLLRHRCPAQSAPSPPMARHPQPGIAGLGQRADSKYHLLDICSTDDDAEDHSNSHRHRHGHRRSDGHNQSGLSNHNQHNHSGDGHRSSTPMLIRAERERLRQKKAVDEERDREFARSLQREWDGEQRERERVERERMERERMDREHERMEREAAEWRRRLERERENHRQTQLVLGSLDDLYGGGLRDSDLEDQENLDISNLSYEALMERFPVQSQGAREETIRRLPIEEYRARGPAPPCSFCLEPFADGDKVRRLQCLHIFHDEEIVKWLRSNRECPICRCNVENHI